MNIKVNFLRSPLWQTIFFLVVLAMAAIISQIVHASHSLEIIGKLSSHLTATLGIALMWYFIFQKIWHRKKNLENTIITALILFLTINYPNDIASFFTICFATTGAMIMKIFFVIQKKPILNPVIAGILTGVLVTFFFPDIRFFAHWWGVSFEKIFEIANIPIKISFIFLLLWIIFGLWKWRKFPTFFAFLATVFLIFFLTGRPWGFIGFTFLDSTILFYAGMMLIEPKTSPVKWNEQIGFGVLAGGFFAGLNSFLPFADSFGNFVLSLTYYYDIVALLVANLAFVGMRILLGRK